MSTDRAIDMRGAATAPCEMSATEAAGAIADGTITSEDLVASCLERVALRDADVQAWAFIDPDLALEQARAADAAEPTGPLHGVPVALKDIIDAHGMPTGFNSPIYPGYVPFADSACAAMIRKAGGIIFGKAVTTEFANRHPGPTRNPHDPARTPGGSSSGSAAAVADFQVPLALGTQTSGSMIRPAAYCGVVGYKPSFGEISRVGVKQQSGTLDTVGLCARSVGDIELLHAALVSGQYRPAAPGGLGVRIALCRPGDWDAADAPGREAVEGAASALSDAGADISEIALPPALFDGYADHHRRIANFEAARNFGFEKTRRAELLSRELYEGRIRDGEKCTLEQYVAAQRKGEAMRAWMDEAFEGIDAILTLPCGGEAPLGLSETGSARYNSLWTLLYTPCLTLPWGTGPNGMPLGIQLVGRRFEDEKLFALASSIETLAKSC